MCTFLPIRVTQRVIQNFSTLLCYATFISARADNLAKHYGSSLATTLLT